MNKLHNDYANDTKLLSLGWGFIDESYYPNIVLENAIQYAIGKYKYGILQYESNYGLYDLRKDISLWAPTFFKIPDFFIEEILITNGITGALDLAGRALLYGKYNAFIIEPCYDTAIESLKRNSSSIKSISCNADLNGNLIINKQQWQEIEKNFSSGKIKIFYTVPNYSNPTGFSIKLEDKMLLGALCKKYSVYIFEDDPYRLYKYSNDNFSQTFFELFPELTLYSNSLSKVGFPGLRVGFIITRNIEILGQMANIQKYAHSSPNLITQGMAEFLIKNNYIDDIFFKRNEVMKRKFKITIEKLQSRFYTDIIGIKGGFYLWLGVENGAKFADFARKNGLVVIPGNIYGANYSFNEKIRVTFSQIEESNLEQALKRLLSL